MGKHGKPVEDNRRFIFK